MSTILAFPVRRSDPADAQAAPDAQTTPGARPAPPAAPAEQDALDWIVTACADLLAVATQPTRAALAAHLLAGAGYEIADGPDARARTMRVDLATAIASRLLDSEPAETER